MRACVRATYVLLIYRGRSTELMRCWSAIGSDQMAQQYCDAVKRLHDGKAGGGLACWIAVISNVLYLESRDDVDQLNKVACLYENVGRFLKDLGLLSQVREGLGALLRFCFDMRYFF